MSDLDLTALRATAQTAQAVTSLAHTLGFDGWNLPGIPSELVEHFAAFDPPTVLALLARLENAEAAARTAWDVHAEHTDRTCEQIAQLSGDLTFTRMYARRLLDEPGVQHLLPPNWRARMDRVLDGGAP